MSNNVRRSFSYERVKGWDTSTYVVHRQDWDKKEVARFYTEKEAAAYVRWRNSADGRAENTDGDTP